MTNDPHGVKRARLVRALKEARRAIDEALAADGTHEAAAVKPKREPRPPFITGIRTTPERVPPKREPMPPRPDRKPRKANPIPIRIHDKPPTANERYLVKHRLDKLAQEHTLNLVAERGDKGVSVILVARVFRITLNAARHRLNSLVETGLVLPPDERGIFRGVPPKEQPINAAA